MRPPPGFQELGELISGVPLDNFNQAVTEVMEAATNIFKWYGLPYDTLPLALSLLLAATAKTAEVVAAREARMAGEYSKNNGSKAF